MSDTKLPMGRRRVRGRTLLALGATCTVVVAVTGPGAATAKPLRAEVSGLYLVQLAGDPLAGYAGGVDGIPATRPAAGEKLNTRTWNYAAYRKHLQGQRADALRKAGIDADRKLVDYGVTFNGFAATLDPAELDRLGRTDGVVKIFKNRVHNSRAADVPGFLGLSGATGTWQQQFGGQELAGEGVIVGVIDSGFWPENPSFGALPEPRPDADTIGAKWNGACAPGDAKPTVACNNKVIGARWYDQSGDFRTRAGEFASPRDRNGHGSHTASTAAGLPVDASVGGEPFGRVSGVAPAARLAIYKVLWHDQESGSSSGSTVDILSAIDDAVADGVDVINYSVGDDADAVDAVDVAFLQAAAAGVFVAAAAGNSGPDASTVDNTMPWETTVGAGTHDVRYSKTVSLGSGQRFDGAGIGAALPVAPLIDAATAGRPGAEDPFLCRPDALDPAKVTGKIVVCTRGGNARVNKSAVVKAAGGVGMVLVNSAPGESVNAEMHSVPTTHLAAADGAAVRAYAATPGATAALAEDAATPQRGPGVATFSSAGPSRSNGGDLLKPDVIAPGVDIVAAVPPISNVAGSNHDLKGGTSMAAPHVAGIGALLKQKFPGWSPSAVQSALMTTAGTVDNTGQPIARADATADPLVTGAGQVRPAATFDPGLVYESGPLEWLQYTCGIGVTLLVGDGSSVCESTGAIDPSNLNYPSIAIGDFAGRQTVTRFVTNTTNQASVYVAKVQAPPGVTVTVNPPVLTVLPRRSASYTVEFTRNGAPFDSYGFGALTWSDLRGHSVRSPLAVQPRAVSGPGQLTLTGPAGSRNVEVGVGYAGVVTATPYGLVPSAVQTAPLTGHEPSFDPAAPAPGPAVGRFVVDVPAGVKEARFATFADQYPEGTDLDVFVYRDGRPIGQSAGSSAQESVTVTAGGRYVVYVVQFALAVGLEQQDVILHSFALGAAGAGNLTVDPPSRQVVLGQKVPFTLNWTGMIAGTRYLGVVEYGDAAGAVHARTLIQATG